MTKFAVFDTKSYDRDSLGPVAAAACVELTYFDFRLDADSVEVVRDVDGVCVFVHDDLPREVIEQLAAAGVKMIVLRCAGFTMSIFRQPRTTGSRWFGFRPTPLMQWPNTRSC